MTNTHDVSAMVTDPAPPLSPRVRLIVLALAACLSQIGGALSSLAKELKIIVM